MSFIIHSFPPFLLLNICLKQLKIILTKKAEPTTGSSFHINLQNIYIDHLLLSFAFLFH